MINKLDSMTIWLCCCVCVLLLCLFFMTQWRQDSTIPDASALQPSITLRAFFEDAASGASQPQPVSSGYASKKTVLRASSSAFAEQDAGYYSSFPSSILLTTTIMPPCTRYATANRGFTPY